MGMQKDPASVLTMTMTAIITPQTRLEELMAASQDTVMIHLMCAASDYSASRLARAVEDVDVPLLALWTCPATDGYIPVSIIVGASDSTAVRRSLERYGYQVTAAYDSTPPADSRIATERLGQLRVLLDV